MITPHSIAEAVAAAAFGSWAIYTEYRLQRADGSNSLLKRAYDDQQIEDATKSESDATLLDELSKDVSGGTPSKS